MSEQSFIFGWFSLSDREHLFKIVGIAAAGGFFGYKAVTGYHVVNLSLKVSSQRKHIPSTRDDHLMVTVTLSKGDRGTIRLRGGSVRIMANPRVASQEAQSGEIETHDGTYLPLFGLERFAHDRNEVPGNSRGRQFWRINWRKRSDISPYLNISPGDEASFCAYGRLSQDDTYKVDVAIIGKRAFGWKTGQWRATLISLPDNELVKEGGAESGAAIPTLA